MDKSQSYINSVSASHAIKNKYNESLNILFVRCCVTSNYYDNITNCIQTPPPLLLADCLNGHSPPGSQINISSYRVHVRMTLEPWNKRKYPVLQESDAGYKDQGYPFCSFFIVQLNFEFIFANKSAYTDYNT